MIQLLFTPRYSFHHPDSNQMLNRVLRVSTKSGAMVNNLARPGRRQPSGLSQDYEILHLSEPGINFPAKTAGCFVKIRAKAGTNQRRITDKRFFRFCSPLDVVSSSSGGHARHPSAEGSPQKG